MSLVATIKMADGKIMKLNLLKEYAPNTVANFVSLANNGFYDGLIFHRIIEGFMIQGGCPQGIGIGGPGYRIKGEFKRNGFNNELKHERGVISMARSALPNSAGSQFFIMHHDAPHLDGDYAAFGILTEGFDVLDSLAAVACDRQDKPLHDQKIASIRVEGDELDSLPELEKYC